MYLKNLNKVVIKIGSSLLIDKSKKIRMKWLTEFSKDIKQLLNQNKKIIIVSSGAIAIGCKKLNINKKKKSTSSVKKSVLKYYFGGTLFVLTKVKWTHIQMNKEQG